jgi:hypothetical protein
LRPEPEPHRDAPMHAHDRLEVSSTPLHAYSIDVAGTEPISTCWPSCRQLRNMLSRGHGDASLKRLLRKSDIFFDNDFHHASITSQQHEIAKMAEKQGFYDICERDRIYPLDLH